MREVVLKVFSRGAALLAAGMGLVAMLAWAVAVPAQEPAAPAAPAVNDKPKAPEPAAAVMTQAASPEEGAPKGRKIELDGAAVAEDDLEAAKLENVPPVTPPLSLYECGLLMQEAIVTLERGKEPLTDTGRRLYVDRILRQVISYVDLIDRSYPTLPYYKWQLIAAEKAPPGDWDTMVLRPRGSLGNITALSLRARHGDVEIRRIVAIDKDETRWEFNRAMHIVSEQARPEVCFLPMPTRLVEIRIDCRRTDPTRPNRPRLYLHAGQSDVPEWAKQSIFKMQLARDILRRGHFGQAAASLREAYALLEKFQKEREL